MDKRASEAWYIYVYICISEVALCRNSGLPFSGGRNRFDLKTYESKLGPKGQGTRQKGGERERKRERRRERER